MTTPRTAAPVAHAQSPRARLPAYSTRARSYESDTGAFQPYRQAIVGALPLRRGEVVLDVGCGTGLYCGMLRNKVGPQGGVIGIEESPEMLAVAREHIAGEGWDNVTLVQSPAEDAQLAVDADEGTAAASILASRARGYMDGRTLAEVFAWLRPNDLIWNYWVNNYLQGKPPPPFDILYWNADTTRMPAALHRNFIEIAMTNALTKPGAVSMLGSPVDLSKIDVDLAWRRPGLARRRPGPA